MGFSLPLQLPLPRRGRRGGRSLRLPLGRVPTALLCAILALPVLGGGWLWFRGSSLVAVEHVHIAGVRSGPQAIEIRTALDDAARRMTSLHYSVAALRAAVAPYPIVARLSASGSFPHTLRIAVDERPPVAVLVGPGERTAVAADGTVLGPALTSGSLPTIAAKRLQGAPGARSSEAGALAAVTVLGAAPPALARYVARVYEGDEGLTVQMRNGLLAYFGDATRPHAKWLSLARVLSSPGAAGAVYVDVRLPERPAAGFSQPDSSAATGATTSTSTSTSSAGAIADQIGSGDATATRLAERLAQEVGGAGTAGEPSTTNGESSGSSEGGSASAEAGSPTGGETSAEGASEGSPEH